MSEMKRCAACGKESPVSEMKVCMHHQMHRYVCDSKCMTDFYNPPKKPTAAELEAKVAALEAENAKLRAELERRAPDGWSVTEDGDSIIVRPDGRMAVELSKGGRIGERVMWEFMRAMLAAAPSAPKADDPVKVQLLEALEELMYAHTDKAEVLAESAIAAARRGEWK